MTAGGSFRLSSMTVKRTETIAARMTTALLLGLLALGAGCSLGGDSDADLILAQSSQVTFETVLQLGSNRMESTIVTEHAETGVREMESMEIAWADRDNFMVRQVHDGDVRREVRVLQGKPWVRSGDRFQRREDAEIYRGVLSQTWDMWGLAVGPFIDQVGYDYDGEVVIEGRRGHRYTLRLATDAELAAAHAESDATQGRRTARFVPMAITGSMVLDEGTAVRLLTEFEVRLVARGGGRERTVRFREARSGIGERPTIPSPRQKK